MSSPSPLFKHVLAVAGFAMLSFALTRIYADEQHATSAATSLLPAETADTCVSIVFPEADSVTTGFSRHRIAAHTHPGNRVFLDQNEFKVWPTGAFVALVDLEPGENRVELSVQADGQWQCRHTLHFYRTHPPETTPSTPLAIDTAMMAPDQELDLMPGDVLRVRMKGSTGRQAFFRLPGLTDYLPMTEERRVGTGGVGGIYAAEYTFDSSDLAENLAVEFILTDGRDTVRAATAPVVSMVPGRYPAVAGIVSRGAFLNAGTGIDRLGGARAGFLERDVRLTVLGRQGSHYRIRLSEENEAFLPVRFGRLLPSDTPLPRGKTGSVSVQHRTDHDLVLVSLSERLPYTTRMLEQPARIEIDLYGAVSTPHHLSHAHQAQGINRVEWEQLGEEHLRLSIFLAHESHWGFHIGYGTGTSLRVQVQRPAHSASADRPLQGVRIALDAGHGGSNSGALGTTGIAEKVVVMEIARFIKERLDEEGAYVLMTRESDYDVSLSERIDMAVASGSHVLVSVHANSIGANVNPDAIRGTATYYRHEAMRSLPALVHRRMLELPLADFGLRGNFNFLLNEITEMPSVLVETAFLSNPEDEMKLLDAGFQQQMAEQVVLGLRDFFATHAVTKAPEIRAER